MVVHSSFTKINAPNQFNIQHCEKVWSHMSSKLTTLSHKASHPVRLRQVVGLLSPIYGNKIKSISLTGYDSCDRQEVHVTGSGSGGRKWFT